MLAGAPFRAQLGLQPSCRHAAQQILTICFSALHKTRQSIACAIGRSGAASVIVDTAYTELTTHHCTSASSDTQALDESCNHLALWWLAQARHAQNIKLTKHIQNCEHCRGSHVVSRCTANTQHFSVNLLQHSATHLHSSCGTTQYPSDGCDGLSQVCA